MALTDDQKAQAKSMHFDQGMSAVQIAEAFGMFKPDGKPNHVAVLGTLVQEKVKRGLMPSPGKAPRKVRETKVVTYDEPLGNQGGDPLLASLGGQAPSNLGPLFSGVPGAIERVEINRTHAVPRSAGTGIVGEVDGQVTGADLQAMFGGGRLACTAYDANNRRVGYKVITIAGSSKRIDMEDEGGAGGMYYPMPEQSNPMMAMVMQLQNQIAQMSTRDREDDRLTFEQRLTLERERMKADAEMRDRSHQQAMQLQNAANQQMMQVVVAATQQSKGSMAETLTLLTTAKDLFGDSGGDTGDTTAELVKMVPKALDSIKGLAAMRQVQPIANPQGGAPQQITLDQAQQAMFQALVQNGLSEEEAMIALQRAGEFLEKKVMDKRQALQAKASAPKPAAVPVVPRPVTAVPPSGAGAAALPANGQAAKPPQPAQQVPNPAEPAQA